MRANPSLDTHSGTIAVVDARVWTGDPQNPWAEAILTDGDQVAVVGSTAEVRTAAGSTTRMIDGRGRFLVPGFIDAHVHFVDGGFRLESVQLRSARTREEFTERVAAFAATVPPGTWLSGGDWDHEQWGGQLPERSWIDSVTPRHPVFVSRLDGHMALANSLALRLAGITRDTGDLEGGTITRDAAGELTGVLKDNAMGLVIAAIPEPTLESLERALNAAMRYVAEQGVTSVHNMGTWRDLETFERARAAGRLRTRIYAAVPLASWERLREHVEAHGRGDDDWLRVGGLKAFADGSLGSHTASMLEPFSDAPDDSGLEVTSPEDMEAWTRGADRAGLHVIVHAIGDRAIRQQLDIFERIARAHGPRDRRFRIEHAQHVSPQDFPRFARLGVIASMQPYHAIDDGRWAERVIGPVRARTTYAFRSLIDELAPLAFGSDWFVAPPMPLQGIYAAVTRRTIDDLRPDGWIPEQRITVEEALSAYTTGGARAEFAEEAKGMLRPGMLADFVLLDQDLTRIDPVAIRDAQVLLTVVGGDVAFERPGTLD
jgi:predicted amidohydrolase YtcJ